MPKKKRFDKKNASHFHIVHRSQRDVTEDEDGRRSEYVLVKQQGQKDDHDRREVDVDLEQEQTFVNMDDLKDKFADLHVLANDGEYDYSKHYKSMGGGDFLDANDGKISDQRLDDRAVEVPMDTIEVERMLESINLNPKFIDDEIHDALFNFEESGFEEILDDFCVTAAQASADDDGEAFDYDAHIQAMIEKAKTIEGGESSGNIRKDIDNFFQSSVPLGRHRDDESDDDADSWDQEYGATDTVQTSYRNPKLSPDEERALLEKFEQTLAEYDSDEVGDLYNAEEEIMNNGALDVFEENNVMNDILDSYLEEKDDDQLFEGIQKGARSGGSGYSYLVKGKMIRVDQLNPEDNNEEPVESDDESASDMMAEMEPPAEEILIDGKSYFTERSVNPWDCESILSTYSNLDNNPAIIGSSRRRKKMTKTNQLPSISNEPNQIMLSNKSGLPMGVLPITAKVEKSIHVPKQVVRKRGESKEERKARKAEAKMSKQEARLQKKVMKGVFAEEFAKRSAAINADDVGCVPVFRYS